ncbi:MAG: ABC transporter ATP-binding protein [Planctomycetes bacterium]|nr:ABC transporter ATP-binding protein [Planctomycetota bacterium]
MGKTANLVKEILDFSKKYRILLALSLGSILVVSFIDRGRAYLLKPLLDSASSQKEQISEILKTIILQFAILSLILAFFKYVKEVLTNYITQKMIFDIRNRISEKIISLDLSFFIKTKSGDMVSRISNDSVGVEQVITFFFDDLIMNTCYCITSLTLMFAASMYLGLLTLTFLPIYVLPINKIAKKLKEKRLKSLIYLGEVLDNFVRFYRGIKVIKSLNKEEEEIKRFRSSNREFFKKIMQAVQKRALSLSIVELFIAASLMLLFFVIGLLANRELITAGSMALFSYALATFNTSIRGFTKGYNRVQEGLPACERILEILKLEPEIMSGNIKIDKIRLIEFRNVNFSYGIETVLRNVSFRINAGEIVAIAGKSGVGKTTIIDLLCKYYKIQQGQILVNGIDIYDIDTKSLRQCIGYCPQDAVIFNGTIKENILYANQEAGEEQLQQVIELTGIADFAGTPDELSRSVGENGQALSGGQRQRISISRALLKPISLLLMDEPTSQMDLKTEKRIKDVLDKFVHDCNKEHMAIIISHRYSTLQYTDRVLILEDGAVVEEGKPSDSKVKKWVSSLPEAERYLE